MNEQNSSTCNKLSYRSLWKVLGPYWWSEEKWAGRGLLAVIVTLNLGLVYVTVLFNQWNRLFYNSIQNKDYGSFKTQLLRFSVLAFIYIAVSVYRLYLNQMLEMKWRRWLTSRYLERWMTHQVYYHMEVQRNGTDNPDQRIAEDIRLFTNGALSLSLGLLSSVVTLASFTGILWALSGISQPYARRTRHSHPGIHGLGCPYLRVFRQLPDPLIGKALIALNFKQQHYEADFRFGLVRVRENAEGIALYRGEASEQENLNSRFVHILKNWWGIMKCQKRLTWFTSSYSQVAIIFPILVASPRFFSGAIQLGGLMQIASAFSNVQVALSWFIDNYRPFAEWKSSVDRLTSFHEAICKTQSKQDELPDLQVNAENSPALSIDKLNLRLPDGRVLVHNLTMTVSPGERFLVRGPREWGKARCFEQLQAFGRLVPVRSAFMGAPVSFLFPRSLICRSGHCAMRSLIRKNRELFVNPRLKKLWISAV